MNIKDFNVSGTRDFTPADMAARRAIFDGMESVFKEYGYLQIETPALENMSLLLSKGENSRDMYSFDNKNLGLRYDLTVPLARYVVNHANDINLPFRRYQFQPVWRTDRPQAGRYREFYQFDIDVMGDSGPACAVEMFAIVNRVFDYLDLQYTLQINNKKLLLALVNMVVVSSEHVDEYVRILDKCDKIGIEGVCEELGKQGFADTQISWAREIYYLGGKFTDTVKRIYRQFKDEPSVMEGLEELVDDIRTLNKFNNRLLDNIVFNPMLARGLDYYTGLVFEVKLIDGNLSVAAGGRYDNFVGRHGNEQMPSIGMSFGFERLFDAVKDPENLSYYNFNDVDCCVCTVTKDESVYALHVAQFLRNKGRRVVVLADDKKIQKKMKQANGLGVDTVYIVGPTEKREHTVVKKYMQSGEQKTVNFVDL